MSPVLSEIAVLVEDEPEPEDAPRGMTLLGLFRGIPITARGGRVPGSIPDTITLFRRPILRACDSLDAVPARVLKVLGHEVGHAMGIGEGGCAPSAGMSPRCEHGGAVSGDSLDGSTDMP